MKKITIYLATITVASLLIAIMGIHRLYALPGISFTTICLSGGPGATSCGNGLYIDCEVSCAPGYYACCNIISCFCIYDGVTNKDNDDNNDGYEIDDDQNKDLVQY